MAGKLTPQRASLIGKLGGRPKGSKTQAVKDREVAFQAYKERVSQNVNNLLNHQLSLARGLQFLYKIEINSKTKAKSRPILIEDQETLEAFLNGDLDNEKDEYYYLTTKEPNNQAIDSMMDRTYGRAVAVTQLEGPGGGPLEIKIIKYGDNASS